MKKLLILGGILFIVLLASCKEKSINSAKGNWIKGTEQEKIKIIERQFRGFDMAMVETGYRYQELYWGGQDENWEYANYQLEKMEKSIKNGLERRPKRAKSAEFFLNTTIPEMKKTLKKKNKQAFNQEFKVMTNSCIACHSMERVPYITVKEPLYRVSPIRK